MKTILMISPAISVKGGISTVIKGLMSSRLKDDYRILLVASHVDGPKYRKLFQAIRGLLLLVYLNCVHRIDIFHIHCGDLISVKRKYFYFRICRWFRKRIIVHFHGASFKSQYAEASPSWQERVRHIFTKADLVICLSQSWRTAILAIAPAARVQVIHNGVTPPSPDVSAGRGERVGFNLTFLGHIGARKGVFDLLQVMEMLVQGGYPVRLNIGGDGEIERLRREVRKRGIQRRVSYLGWISAGERDRLLRETDLFVLPSYGEGMPMSILEAMSYGLPVISTTVGGVPELVAHGRTGFLVEPGDTKGLYAKIEKLFTDEPLRHKMGREAARAIRERFNAAKVANQMGIIYGGL